MIVIVNFAAWDMVALSVTILILESEHVGVPGLDFRFPVLKVVMALVMTLSKVYCSWIHFLAFRIMGMGILFFDGNIFQISPMNVP